MRAVILAAVVLLAVQTHAFAADPASWIGVKVLPKLDAVVKAGNKTIDYKEFSLPWIVQDVKDDLLLVGDDGEILSEQDKVWQRCFQALIPGGRLISVVDDVSRSWRKNYRKGWVQRSDVVTVDEAPDYYTKLINSNQHTAQAYFYRAIAWQEKGDLESAIADSGEGLRLKEAAFKDILSGAALSKKKDYDNAIADFNEAISLDPDSVFAYVNRGIAWKGKKDYDSAIADYNEAIRLDPNNGFAYDNRGVAWEGKKDYDRAIADYNEAIRLNPNYGEPLNNAAWLLATCADARIRNGKKAVKLATKAYELASWTKYDLLDTLAAAHAEAGDFDSAIKYQNKAIELNPNDAEFVKGGKERLALYEDHKPYRQGDCGQ